MCKVCKEISDKNMVEQHSELESIDQILANLKKNPDYYNHSMTEEMWMQECNRND